MRPLFGDMNDEEMRGQSSRRQNNGRRHTNNYLVVYPREVPAHNNEADTGLGSTRQKGNDLRNSLAPATIGCVLSPDDPGVNRRISWLPFQKEEALTLALLGEHSIPFSVLPSFNMINERLIIPFDQIWHNILEEENVADDRSG